MDVTDVAAWVGALTGVGSLFVSGATYQRHRNEPVLSAQRDLRAAVLGDAEAVRVLLDEAAQAASSRGPLAIESSPARRLHGWVGKQNQFTKQEVPNVILEEMPTLLKWDFAVHDYKMAHRSTESAASRARASSGEPRDPDEAERQQPARDDLIAKAQDLSTRSEAAMTAVNRVIATLHAIAKRPGT